MKNILLTAVLWAALGVAAVFTFLGDCFYLVGDLARTAAKRVER